MRFRVLGILAGSAAALGGAISLGGWIAGVPRLTDWFDDGIAMQPNTGVAATSAGLAMLLINVQTSPPRPFVAWAVRALALFVSAIGAMALSQHLFAWNLGIDRLLIDPKWGERATVSPGRMGPPASLTFLLLGIGMVLSTGAQRSAARRLASAFGLVATVPPLISWTAFLYSADPLYSMPGLTGIARQTATILFVLALCLVLSIREFGLGALVRRRDSAGTLVRILLPVSVVLLLLTGWLEDYGVSEGLYDTSLGNAALTVIRVIMFVALLWGTAATIGHQIERRSRVESALRESEQRFRTMADAAPVLIWVGGIDKHRTWFNRRWIDFVGRPMERNLGQGWMKHVHPDDLQSCSFQYIDAFDERQPFEMTYRLRRHDGEYRWVLDHGVPLQAPDGSFAGFIGSCIDITERKLLEDQLVERRDELEREVQQRTAELMRARERMLLHDRMAAVGTLAAGLSHDITNLLLPLGMRVHALETSSDIPPQVRSELSIIETLLDHLRKLSRNLSLFWRNPDDAGASVASAENVTHLGQWFQDIHRLLDASLGREIVIRWEVGDDLPPVAIAPHRLTQAVQNLIHNARDAVMSARAQGRFTLRADQTQTADIIVSATHAAPQRCVLLHVTDFGMGMSDDVKARCLDPFFTTKDADRSAAGGSGLGLSLAHQLIRDSSGTLSIDSTEGRGTIITLTLPRAIGEVEVIHRQHTTKRSMQPGQSRHT